MSASLPEPELELGATSAPAIVSGGLWTLLSRVLPQAQLLILSIVVARYLGPDEMGRQSYIAFVALACVQAATAGLPGAISRFVGELLGSRRGGEALSLYRLTQRIEILGAVLVLIVLLGAAFLGSEPRTAWILAGLSAALSVLQAVPAALLMGAQRWRAGLDARARHRRRDGPRGRDRPGAGRRHQRAVRGRGRGGVHQPRVDVRAGAADRGRAGAGLAGGPGAAAPLLVLRRVDVGDRDHQLRRLAALGAVHPPALLHRRPDRVLLDRVRHASAGCRSCPRRSRP